MNTGLIKPKVYHDVDIKPSRGFCFFLGYQRHGFYPTKGKAQAKLDRLWAAAVALAYDELTDPPTAKDAAQALQSKEKPNANQSPPVGHPSPSGTRTPRTPASVPAGQRSSGRGRKKVSSHIPRGKRHSDGQGVRRRDSGGRGKRSRRRSGTTHSRRPQKSKKPKQDRLF